MIAAPRTSAAQPEHTGGGVTQSGVTSHALASHERRGLILSPDRRNFMHSMNVEAAHRVSGQAVPPDIKKRFAYTFSHKYFNPAKGQASHAELQWLHNADGAAPSSHNISANLRSNSRYSARDTTSFDRVPLEGPRVQRGDRTNRYEEVNDPPMSVKDLRARYESSITDGSRATHLDGKPTTPRRDDTWPRRATPTPRRVSRYDTEQEPGHSHPASSSTRARYHERSMRHGDGRDQSGSYSAR